MSLRALTAIAICLTLPLATGCTRPGKTTAVGSGVGGAIGAGLGAIVGNQSGNAGSGLAIGAAAGAATGAIIGNALQAQEDRSRAQDETMRRQEKVIAAQKNEITELRSIASDADNSLSYNSIAPSSVRYRYRPTTTSMDSPEVAKQRARLQRRGPVPSSGSIVTKSYYQDTPPTFNSRTQSGPTTSSSKTIARYDVRSELVKAPTKLEVKKAPVVPAPVLALPQTELPKVEAPKIEETNLINEVATDNEFIAQAESQTTRAANTAATAKAVIPPTKATSPKCKEALEERDLAVAASDNSDKLFHLRRALRLCPDSAPLHHELGKVYAAMERPKDAEDEYKQALSADPNFTASKNALSSMLKEEVQF